MSNGLNLPAPESLGPTITIGEILVEIMATEPGTGFLEPLALVGPFPSGAPAIFIDQVAKLGAGAGIIASVGDDDFGRLCTARLARDGVDISAVSTSASRPTGSAFVRYRREGGRDFVFNIAHSAAGEIVPAPAATALIERAGHLHVMGSALSIAGAWPVLQQALETVKRRGGSVSFDPNLRKELLGSDGMMARFRVILAQTDVFLPSSEEIFLASEAPDIDGAVRDILDRGVGEIVLKEGSSGARRFTSGSVVQSPGFAVTEVDPTGAGDCFGATYIAARRMGRDVADALRLANAAGARNVTLRGPMEGTSTLAELAAFLADRTSA